MIRIGLDLGGTKIEILALDRLGGEVYRKRVSTPRGDYPGTVSVLAALVEEAEGVLGATASVGVGIPGAEGAEDGLVRNANSTWLIGRPLRHDLQQRLRRPVRVANDANCFTLSEATDGAAAGAGCVFGVILGTGVGGGICVDGKILPGANRIAGEWGHNRLPGDEPVWPRCYCGRSGCIETFLSGPGLVADHLRHGGEALSPQQIATTTDGLAAATMQRYERRLARALAVVINILDPDVIVLGGGLSNLDRLYQQVPAWWTAEVFSPTVRTRLVKHRYGDASGVRGAAWLWP